MDRLPLELLRLISTFIERESVPRIRQGALAALCRTNRTWYSVANSRLYLNPVLSNEKRAKQWSNVYSSRVTPWTAHRGEASFASIPAPSSITFKHNRKVDKLDVTVKPIFARLESPYDSSRLFDISLTPFFFRNLTSFSVSRDYPINEAFVAGLFGPNASNRLTITKIKLQSEAAPLFWFLFEAVHYIDHQLVEDLSQELLDQVGAEYGIDRGTSVDQVSDEMWEEIEKHSRRLAPINWAVYELMLPEHQSDDEYYEDIVNSRIVNPTPFSRLRSLVLGFETTVEFYLVFLIHLFPSLRYLKLSGDILPSDHLADDVAMLRASITRRKGVIVAPYVDPELIPFYPNLFDNWTPLTSEELENYVHKPYRGPNLNKLDLSGSLIALPPNIA